MLEDLGIVRAHAHDIVYAFGGLTTNCVCLSALEFYTQNGWILSD